MSDQTAPSTPPRVVYAAGAGVSRHIKHLDVDKTLCGRPVAQTSAPADAEPTCRVCIRRADRNESRGAL